MNKENGTPKKAEESDDEDSDDVEYHWIIHPLHGDDCPTCAKILNKSPLPKPLSKPPFRWIHVNIKPK